MIFELECKLHNTGQGPAEVSRSASFSKLRESLRRSSVKLFHRLAGRHSAHLPPDVDFTDPERFVLVTHTHTTLSIEWLILVTKI